MKRYRRLPAPAVAGLTVATLLTGATLLAGGCAQVDRAGRPHPGPSGRAAASASPAVSARPGHSSPAPTPASGAIDANADADGDPAQFAPQVRRYAVRAGIDPQLLMAILYNESYKPHDPALERAWQKLDPDAAFGVANMHRDAFDDTRRGRDFADRDWQELPDDPSLAIEAAAWYLHDLAAELPAHWPAEYPKDDLLALGYNAGPGSMKAFAQGDRPGTVAQSYLDRLHANWSAAAHALG
jgi:soluble lytic murein transglycosylase-like protein